MAVTEKQLIEELKTGQYKPVYLLTGDENYYIDLVSDYFEKEVISPDFRDFDQTVVYGRDVDMTAVISLAKRYPMMSPVQLVLVKEAQDISKGWELLALSRKPAAPDAARLLLPLQETRQAHQALQGHQRQRCNLREEQAARL